MFLLLHSNEKKSMGASQVACHRNRPHWLFATAVSDGDGYADFEFDSGSTLSPGTYTVKVCGNWNGTSPISSCISSFTISQ